MESSITLSLVGRCVIGRAGSIRKTWARLLHFVGNGVRTSLDDMVAESRGKHGDHQGTCRLGKLLPKRHRHTGSSSMPGYIDRRRLEFVALLWYLGLAIQSKRNSPACAGFRSMRHRASLLGQTLHVVGNR